MDIPHFVCPFISEGYGGGFHHLAIVNNAVMNAHVHIFVGVPVIRSRILYPMVILCLTF